MTTPGSRRFNSRQSATRHWRTPAFVVATQSSAVTRGTTKVSGNQCASVGTVMIDEPKPVAPNTVYAATITHGISTNTYRGAFGSQEAIDIEGNGLLRRLMFDADRGAPKTLAALRFDPNGPDRL